MKKHEIKEGNLYKLGRHMLLCGDSTHPEAYKKLIGNNKIDMVLTDPPYNVDYNNKNKLLNKLGKGNHVQRPIINDVNINETFFTKVYNNWKPYLNEYNSIYIYTADVSIQIILNPFVKEGYVYNNMLTWLKNNHVFSFKDYKKKTEKIIYGWYKKHKFYGGFNTDVLEYKKPQHNRLHPTMKPLKLTAKLITNSTLENMNILDCFGGSGTTLLVAEKLNRNCYMIEKDPYYINIIIQRWEHLTKQKAKVVEI